jgi:hypothetical protein
MRGGGLHIEPEWRDALERAGLGGAALTHGDVGRVVQRKPGREVRRIDLGDARGALYVKRIAISGLRPWIAALRGRDTATREAQELRRVSAAGVGAARPVAFGRAGPRLCVIVTEELRGVDLTRALAEASPPRRRQLLAAMGVLLARLHAAGILHEVRCKDAIVGEDGALGLIDRDPKDALPGLARAEHGALRCLARCEYLRLRGGAQLAPRERLRVLAAYCRARGGASGLRDALPIVRAALARELERHREQPALVAEFGQLSL